MRHANTALFVPHNGCPHRCSFCNQNAITGQAKQPSPADVERAAQRAAETLPKGVPAELAFFGGSFTAIDRDYMVSLLKAAQPFLQAGVFSGIRCSTRPDCIDADILSLLKSYGVKVVELGAQSMDDTVLRRNRRGHTAADVERASGLIRASGLSLGLQMMVGLPGDTPAGAWKTARRLAALRPETMRIYPTIVLPGSLLASWYQEGTYRPLELGEAVELCAGLLSFFEGESIRVIRLGLHSSPELERERLAGPWHPAFRELCESFLFLLAFRREWQKAEEACTAFVNPRDLSAAVGQKRSNVRTLEQEGLRLSVRTKEDVPRGWVEWAENETIRRCCIFDRPSQGTQNVFDAKEEVAVCG